MQILGFRDLIVFRKSYALAIDIFKISKFFPNGEKYSLTDQIRRSSRSIPVNIAESWAKRIYVKAFINKLTDALAEEFETEVWLNMSLDLGYLEIQNHDQLILKYDEIRKMLVSMINNPDKFCK
jgi:four helix bundle protein